MEGVGSRVHVAEGRKAFRHAVVLYVLVILLCSGRSASAQPLDSLVTQAMQYAKTQLARTVADIDDSLLYPRATLPDGRWDQRGPNNWTSGFFPGCLWYIYELTGDTTFSHAAARWTAGLESQKLRTNTHDLGFILYCSFGNAYRLQPTESRRQILLQAATSLATRFNPTVGCTRSWDWGSWTFPVIIDNMMNLELLLWASKNGGPANQADMAASHAVTTGTNHFRADGSTYHVVDYDTTTGAVIWRGTHQGYADESVWARGQAWAIYGFTMVYRETGDSRFLEAAEDAAGYFLDHLPEDWVPYWDFLAPNIPDELRDASAAAIACSALLELSTLEAEVQAASYYFDAGREILAALCQPPYLSEGTPSHGILNHCVGGMPDSVEVDVSLIYADYYFLEAIERYVGITGLPICLQSFDAAYAPGERCVQLRWSTLSETSNLGFLVYKDTARTVQEFDAIPGSFTPGHGTTTIPHTYSYCDTNTSPGTWSYRLGQIDLDGSETYSGPVSVVIPPTADEQTPSAVSTTNELKANYPNPFNPSTAIEYTLASAGPVTLKVYNLVGAEVAVLVEGDHPAGAFTATWDALDMPSGVYFCRLTVREYIQTKKMVLMK